MKRQPEAKKGALSLTPGVSAALNVRTSGVSCDVVEVPVSSQNSHHKIVIVGGGSAGISVAARLLNAGETDVAVIDPAEVHYYQPLWTMVGGGRAPVGESARDQAAVMPQGATWIKEAATDIDRTASASSLPPGRPSATTSSWYARAWPWAGTGCPAPRKTLVLEPHAQGPSLSRHRRPEGKPAGA
jgi:hypothetical protein